MNVAYYTPIVIYGGKQNKIDSFFHSNNVVNFIYFVLNELFCHIFDVTKKLCS